jgi:hypothetical protein
MNVHERLNKIQKELKAPKNQFNKFGGFKYRNCEDILEAVKPLLGDSVLIIHDEIVEVGGRVYVKATATLTDRLVDKNDKPFSLCSTAYAREPESRKGMDDSQITGATSSYARKYALNGLFCIDDTKDADSNAPKKEENLNPPIQPDWVYTPEHKKLLNDLIQSTDSDLPNFLSFIGVTSLVDLTKEQFQKGYAALLKKQGVIDKEGKK